ncbi:hypothetical protein RND71_039627 [Anisodus tanguticus]|uniref:Uncharacterized protein n=1 Tax=Anisodus tanguticus TaxID=243964 RepID=A0AAE1UVI3_9SOLA|nr:hypothetical protein RND71_039627 [Anisodus tanguticus]
MKALCWVDTDTERRKLGERMGLDTIVVLARKVRMTSSHHALGDTRATMAEKKGRDPARDGPATPGKRIEETSDYFMHAPLGSGGYSSVHRASLLQLGHCDYGLDV